MHQDIRQKQLTFILLGGFGLSIFSIAILYALALFVRVQSEYVLYMLMFLAEFGYYCLCLFAYKSWISRVLWFNQGFYILILLTLFKIIVSSLILFFLLPRFGILVLNILGLLGMFARGFVIELAFIALAAKIFETDIFEKDKHRDKRIIDDQFK